MLSVARNPSRNAPARFKNHNTYWPSSPHEVMHPEFKMCTNFYRGDADASPPQIALPMILVCQLGKKSDGKLTVEFTLLASKIRAARLRLSISAVQYVVETREKMAFHGTMPDNQAAG